MTITNIITITNEVLHCTNDVSSEDIGGTIVAVALFFVIGWVLTSIAKR
jgi:hypothetical protein